MKKGKFADILKEYGFSDKQIELLWNAKPPDDLDEFRLRRTAEIIAPIEDTLVQA